MNSLPPEHRGSGSGMNTTFQNSAQVVSIGIFFSLIILGLSASLPQSLYHGLVGHGVPQATAHRVSHLPPVSTLFAAFLGYNPIQHLIGSGVLSQLSPHQQAVLTGRSFFPGAHHPPFRAGLHAAFDFAILASLVAAGGIVVAGRALRLHRDLERAERTHRPGWSDRAEPNACPDWSQRQCDSSRRKSLSAAHPSVAQ